MLRVFYYATLLIFLFGAVVFWMYADQFFHWLYGIGYGEANREAFEQTLSTRENFIWGVVWASVACLVLSILAINSAMKGRLLVYISLLMSAITILVFIISFFGHGVMPMHGII